MITKVWFSFPMYYIVKILLFLKLHSVLKYTDTFKRNIAIAVVFFYLPKSIFKAEMPLGVSLVIIRATFLVVYLYAYYVLVVCKKILCKSKLDKFISCILICTNFPTLKSYQLWWHRCACCIVIFDKFIFCFLIRWRMLIFTFIFKNIYCFIFWCVNLLNLIILRRKNNIPTWLDKLIAITCKIFSHVPLYRLNSLQMIWS